MKILLFLLVCSCVLNSGESAVSYKVKQGRLGDQLLCYLHAKWISHRYGLLLLYKPFLHSEDFALHDFEEWWTEEKEQQFNAVITYKGDEDFSHDSALYLIPYFSATADDRPLYPDSIYFPIDWKDESFLSKMRRCFAARKKYPALVFPDPERLTVALHVRRGGTYDHPDSYLKGPLRFPPDSYYCEALRKLCGLFPGKP